MELLHKIQKELKAPKSQYNSFGKYHYRNCEDILEAVKPFLTDGATLVLSDEVVEVGGRCYVKATATLIDPKGSDAHNMWEATAYAREPLERKGMDESQITGAASSYARKYALNGLFCIDDTKDADSDEAEPAAKPVAKVAAPPKIEAEREAKKKLIKQLCDETSGNPLKTKEDYEAYVEAQTGLKLEVANYDTIIPRLQAFK